jgi:hypothetical protein
MRVINAKTHENNTRFGCGKFVPPAVLPLILVLLQKQYKVSQQLKNGFFFRLIKLKPAAS